ncbi:hypothetical protein CR513_20809, partial [Mucuna pruriens]
MVTFYNGYISHIKGELWNKRYIVVHKTNVLLEGNPLPIPKTIYHSIAMNYMEKLPTTCSKDIIWVMIRSRVTRKIEKGT